MTEALTGPLPPAETKADLLQRQFYALGFTT
jgi:hypothetical protein